MLRTDDGEDRGNNAPIHTRRSVRGSLLPTNLLGSYLLPSTPRILGYLQCDLCRIIVQSYCCDDETHQSTRHALSSQLPVDPNKRYPFLRPVLRVLALRIISRDSLQGLIWRMAINLE